MESMTANVAKNVGQLILWLWLCVLALVLITFAALVWTRFKLRAERRRKRTGNNDSLSIGFFHPYCDAGGGGERVLWTGLRALSTAFPRASFVVYTGDVQSAPDQIVARAASRFNVTVDLSRVEFVYLHRRHWIEPDRYPYFTLLAQSIASIGLGLEALLKFCPDIYIDTMGYAFTLPLFKFVGGCKVGCYVHYPTISSDMLDAVKSRKLAVHNRRQVANSWLFTKLKLQYYHFFAFVYGCVGRCSDLTMVNSSWTEEHIARIWGSSSQVHKIYPPCDVAEFKRLQPPRRSKAIVSIGQFRPEKNHAMQIRALYELRQILSEDDWEQVRLVLIGGCRNAEDEQRVQDLKDLSKHLSVEEHVLFKVNIPFEQLKEEMEQSLIGVHSMWNEHFGIAVVEMMAAGLVTLAHRSGGPLMDIVVEEEVSRNGFLAGHDQEYAQAVKYILELSPAAVEAICQRARSYVDRFSEREFECGWLRATRCLMGEERPVGNC